MEGPSAWGGKAILGQGDFRTYGPEMDPQARWMDSFHGQTFLKTEASFCWETSIFGDRNPPREDLARASSVHLDPVHKITISGVLVAF